MNPYVSEAIANAWTSERIAEAAAWRRARRVSRREPLRREAVRRRVVRAVHGCVAALRPVRPARRTECRRAGG